MTAPSAVTRHTSAAIWTRLGINIEQRSANSMPCALQRAKGLKDGHQTAGDPNERRGNRSAPQRNPASHGETDRDEHRDPEREQIEPAHHSDEQRRRRVGIEKTPRPESDTEAAVHLRRIEKQSLKAV